MDAFVVMKKIINSNLSEQRYINNQVFKNTEDITLLQETFEKFDEKKDINHIYFEGQIYDAYSKILEKYNSQYNNLTILKNNTLWK